VGEEEEAMTSRPGPWITPALENGWTSHEYWPLRWRIAADGALSFTGSAIPLDGDYSKPLFRLNLIYRHFFGQTVRMAYGDEIVTCRIDDEGWVYAESTDADR
jgi:hypothetical protein